MRLRVTWTATYTADEDAYGTTDAAEAARIDQQQIEEGDIDITDLFGLADSESVTVEPIND